MEKLIQKIRRPGKKVTSTCLRYSTCYGGFAVSNTLKMKTDAEKEVPV